MPGKKSSIRWSHTKREVQSASGHWYPMRILPYRTQKNAIAGVVITFVEITRQKAHAVTNYNNCCSKSKRTPTPGSIVDTVREPLLVLDAEFACRRESRVL